MNAQQNETILKSIEVLDKTADDIRKANTTAIYELADKKKELAVQIFDDSEYIKEYIIHFHDKFEDSFIDDEYLRRFNSFDFSKVSSSIKDELINYMQECHGMYYYSDDYREGFTVDSFDNIYISYDHEVFADFSKKSYKFNRDSELHLFLIIELLMQEHGIYPDIVELDYYGYYYADYEMPEEYRFLKTGMHEKEDRLVWFLENLKRLFENDLYSYDENFIVENFTPDFIKKINNNLSVDLYNVELSDNFDLHIEYEVNTKLKEKDLKKLNVEYTYTKYNTTMIIIDTNIEQYLKDELEKGYSFDDLRKK